MATRETIIVVLFRNVEGTVLVDVIESLDVLLTVAYCSNWKVTQSLREMALEKPQIIGHVEKSMNFTLFETRWIPCSAKFVVLGSHARGTGALQIYELSQGDVKPCLQLEKSKSMKCGTFGASSIHSRHLATGDFEGNLQIWNLEKPELSIYNVKAHKEIINCVDGVGGLVGEGAPEIVTGSRDGCVKVWDPRQKDDPVATMMPSANETKRDCWTVAFGHSHNVDDRCVCAGYDNGDIKMFDLRSMKLRWEHNVKNGVCCLEFDRKDIDMNKLVATTLESKFHVFDLRTQHPKKGFASLTEKCHDSTVWLARHLPQNRDVFMTCGGNGTLNLWQYQYPSKRVEKDAEGVACGVAGTLGLVQNIKMSTQPITSFDWSPDKPGLGVCSALDQTLRVLIVTKLNTL